MNNHEEKNMSDKPESKTEEWNRIVWMGKLGVTALWSFVILVLWALWFQAGMNDPVMVQDDTAIGILGCTSVGCCGGTWFIGLIGVLLVASVLRR